MSIRDLYNMVLALAAGFLVIATQVFTATTGAWIGFGIAVGATLLSAGLVATRLDVVQRSLTGVAGVIGAWTIVPRSCSPRRPRPRSPSPRRSPSSASPLSA
jgi:hypothetical protein